MMLKNSILKNGIGIESQKQYMNKLEIKDVWKQGDAQVL